MLPAMPPELPALLMVRHLWRRFHLCRR